MKPDLSVVVTVVEGEPALTRCLEALAAQVDAPSLEVIVPYDDTIPEVARLAERFPTVRFLALGRLAQGSSPCDAYEAHDLYDRRRAGGLRAARGRLVGMLEDRGSPRADWARAMVLLHEDAHCAAIGGAIENAADGALRWAVFFCDFGRYQPPLESGDPEYLCDINICYEREALESVSGLWEERYRETTVNWALRRQGRTLRLSDLPRVVHRRGPMDLGAMLAERVHWGRIFAEARARESSQVARLARAAFTPLLPGLLFLRYFRRQLRKRRDLREFIRASPAILLLLLCWSLGELLGYVLPRRSPGKRAVSAESPPRVETDA